MFDETVRKLVTKPKDAGEAEVPAATPKPKVPTGGKGGPTRVLQRDELDDIEALLAGATVP